MWWLVLAEVTLVLLLSHPSYTTSPSLIIAPIQLVPEDTAPGSTIGTLNATDADNDIIHVSPSGNTLFYVTLVQIIDVPGFYSANITLNRELDYETTPSPLLLLFEATDEWSMVPSRTEIRLLVTDVNDNPPRFQNLPYFTQIPESIVPGSVVFKATATDPDTGAGGQVYITLLTNTDKFSVTNNGTVTLSKEVDYESLPFYHLQLRATDSGGLYREASLSVEVTDVQDSPPYFTGLPNIIDIPEDLFVDTRIFQVSAQDGDRGNPDNITFTQESSSCPGYFEVHPDGSIVLKTVPDRDSGYIFTNMGICVLTVQASEVIVSSLPQYGNRTTTTETVTITIQDVNDNAPTFSESVYNASVLENSPPGIPLTFLSAPLTVEDKDQGDFAKVSLTLDNYAGDFELVPSTVQGSASVMVKVKNSSILDYEQRQNITLTIRAEQTGRHISSATVQLLIENENDNTPYFNQSTYSARVQEGRSPSTSVITISVTDRDLPPYNNITYTLLNAGGMFVISSSGEVTVASPNIKRKTKPVYLTVVATDTGGRINMAQLTVNITAANNTSLQSHHTLWLNTGYHGYLTENRKHFTKPVVVKAVDVEARGSVQVSYCIIRTYPPGWESHFDVDSTTGNFSLIAPLDNDSLPSGQLVVMVRATDAGSPPLHSDVNVTLSVQGNSGTSCERDPCFNKQCLHGGVCKVTGNSSICQCPSLYIGDLCQNSPCSGFNCSNGGVCTLDLGVPMCSCPAGFTGIRCEHAENTLHTCPSWHCHHRGTCVRTGDSNYLCKCWPDFSGHRCENFDACNVSPCNNGGTCSEGVTGYICDCVTGYTGHNCESVRSNNDFPTSNSDVCEDRSNIDCNYLYSSIKLCDNTTMACQLCPRFCGICDRCEPGTSTQP